MQLYIPDAKHTGKPIFYLEPNENEDLDEMIYVEKNYHRIVNAVKEISVFPAFIDITPGWWNRQTQQT